MSYLDKEYHPVIEDFIADYADQTLDVVEKDTFEEVLAHDSDLRDLAVSAFKGKKLMDLYRKMRKEQKA